MPKINSEHSLNFVLDTLNPMSLDEFNALIESTIDLLKESNAEERIRSLQKVQDNANTIKGDVVVLGDRIVCLFNVR